MLNRVRELFFYTSSRETPSLTGEPRLLVGKLRAAEPSPIHLDIGERSLRLYPDHRLNGDWATTKDWFLVDGGRYTHAGRAARGGEQMTNQEGGDQNGIAQNGNSVLVAIDFSKDSEAALLWACRYALQIGADLTVLHVVHEDDDSGAANAGPPQIIL